MVSFDFRINCRVIIAGDSVMDAQRLPASRERYFVVLVGMRTSYNQLVRHALCQGSEAATEGGR